jgi:dissimilatory sulfite reductase (desulfoviridin) alpha/beta subunit
VRQQRAQRHRLPAHRVARRRAFDVRPFAEATFAYLVRSPFCQQMARKFKIAFSSCPEDCAAAAIHDIGVLGRIEPGPQGPRADSPFSPAADWDRCRSSHRCRAVRAGR